MSTKRQRHYERDDAAYFTVEASLVLPVIFMITIFVLFFCLYLYEEANLYQSAVISAFRTADTWNNSSKSPLTGGYAPGSYDNLYWSLFSNLSSRIAFDGSRVDQSSGSALADRKLVNAVSDLPEKVNGIAEFQNHVITQTVKMQFSFANPFRLPFKLLPDHPLISASAQASVSDPVELIRNVDFLRMMLPEVKQKLADMKSKKSAVEPFEQQQEMENKNDQSLRAGFGTELEARRYLQKSVRGVETTMSIMVQGKKMTRQIDALDSQGIAHQAYLGYISNRFSLGPSGEKFNAQVEKDLQLLREGRVKGVVWHFYRKKLKDGTLEDKVGPSGPLRRSLEQKGIIIVIHH